MGEMPASGSIGTIPYSTEHFVRYCTCMYKYLGTPRPLEQPRSFWLNERPMQSQHDMEEFHDNKVRCCTVQYLLYCTVSLAANGCE